jgi:hypothetical protein
MLNCESWSSFDSRRRFLSTLDSEASIDHVPFMVEMPQYMGTRFTVTHRLGKICETASGDPPKSRRMRAASSGRSPGFAARIGRRRRRMGMVTNSLDSKASLPTGHGRRVRLRGFPPRCTGAKRPGLARAGSLGEFDLSQYVREVTSGNVGHQRERRSPGGKRRVAASLARRRGGLISLISRGLRLPGIRPRVRRLSSRVALGSQHRRRLQDLLGAPQLVVLAARPADLLTLLAGRQRRRRSRRAR